MERPQLQPYWTVQIIAGEGVYLLSELGDILLRGALYEALAPMLDGTRTAAEIDGALRTAGVTKTPGEAFFHIEDMTKRGYLIDAAPGLGKGEAAFWAAQGIAPNDAVEALGEQTISVRTIGDVPSGLEAALITAGAKVAGDGGFTVVLTDDVLHPELAAYDEGDAPWMLVRPRGLAGWIGPIFRPRRAPCWQCFAARVRGARQAAEHVRATASSGSKLARIGTSTTVQAVLHMAAHEAIRSVVFGGHPLLDGAVTTWSPITGETQRHLVVPRGSCERCGDGASRPSRQVDLQPRPKRFTQDGGHRVASPTQTYERFEHLVSPIVGVVRSVDRIGVLEHGGVYLCVAGDNPAVPPRSLDGVRGHLRSLSAGKGVELQQAKTSALCEALERHSGVFRGDEPRKTASFDQLGEAAIDPRHSMLFSERQYAEREAWNARESKFNRVPLPFDPSRPIEWSPLWSLTREAEVWLPTDLLYYRYPRPPDEAFFVSCSNGCAAGNTTEEAILQGLMELVERDAVSQWWYNRAPRPALDLDAADLPYLHRLKAFLQTRGRSLWLLDLTSDLEIPVYAAVSAKVDAQPERVLFGFGAHLDPRIAALRGATEMNQMVAFDEADDDALGIDDPETVRWLESASLAEQPYLAPQQLKPLPRPTFSDDLTQDVLLCKARLEAIGLQLLVLDQTRTDVGLPVVKVVVPGLRHFWARFAPGRLYDVPVARGWLDEPRAEAELNPIPMFL